MRRGTKSVGIYSITSPSGRVYIGQSWNIEHRWAEYRSPGYRSQQPKLHASFRRHGVSNHDFRVILLLGASTSQQVLDESEIFYIAFFRERGVGLLNLRGGGSAGRHSDETKRLIGQKSKGHPPNSTSFRTGASLPRTAEWNQNISRALTGKTLSDETKRKLSEINTGTRHPKYGSKQSEETRRLIAAANRGRIVSSETRRRMSESKRGNNHRLGKAHSEETKQKISRTKRASRV